jgi:[acyl-carrier-protein] S-malonyltransferase
MGKALHDTFQDARDVFQEVDETLKISLSRMMFEGPAEDLTLTANAQPAIMAVSLAAMRVLQKQGGVKLPGAAQWVAGHSLGEYAALAASGSFSLHDTTWLLRTRGEAMQSAVPVGIGSMAAILGLDLPEVEAIVQEAAQGEVCVCANDNSSGQVVISGHKAAVERAMELAKAKGAKRALPLAVSAPFHCPLMQPAAEIMRQALATVMIRPPLSPCIANVTAQPVTDAETIRRLLVEQVTGMVRWRETMQFFAEAGVDTVVELGAGAVLTGLAKRAIDGVRTVNLHTPQEIEAFLEVPAHV